MHAPSHFREQRLDVLHAAMRAYPFATVVTRNANGIEATHLPMLLDAGAGPLGTLTGHVGRGNGQWRDALEGPALVIFQGPHAYVSPNWYPEQRAQGEAVPTWNYVAVHAHGVPEFFDDHGRLRETVTRLSRIHETGQPQPWHPEESRAGHIDALLHGIVGVRVPVDRLEGAWKISQNRSDADRAGVIAGLAASPHPADHAMAELMRTAEGDR